MGVGSDNEGNLTIQKATDRLFLAGGLCMEVDHDHRSLLSNLLNLRLERKKWILQILTHEGLSPAH